MNEMNKLTIPRFTFWLLKRLYVLSQRDGYIGDIEEEYFEKRDSFGKQKADAWIRSHAMKAIPRTVKHNLIWGGVMFRNYFKIALRNIRKQKAYSFINIVGLAVGMACCILILMWVWDEIRFDAFHANIETLYRVAREDKGGASPVHKGNTSGPLAMALKNEYPEIMNATRFAGYPGHCLVGYGDEVFREAGVAFADPAFLEMFSFDVKRGDRSTVLDLPNSILISESMASKYFGDDDPMGRTLTLDTNVDCQVTGILYDIPQNSQLQFDFLVPFELVDDLNIGDIEQWWYNAYTTFVQLQEGASSADVDAKIGNLLGEKGVYEQDPDRLYLQAFERIHLHSNLENDFEGLGDIRTVWIFSALAVFILLLACINFMNLSTSRSTQRAMEVGLRKMAGAYRKNIIRQFFGESFVFVGIAFLLALLFVGLVLPAFNNLAGKSLTLSLSGPIILGLLGIALLTGLISGAYPAVVLSAFPPVDVVKDFSAGSKRGGALRRLLVIFQFAITVILLAGTFIIQRQQSYMLSQDMGFDKEHVVYIGMAGDQFERYDAIKNRLLQDPNIENISASFQLPHSITSSIGDPDFDGKQPGQKIFMNFESVDFDYFETVGMVMAEGRGFSRDFATDIAEGYVVNEAAVKAMGMEEPVGKMFAMSPRRKGRIIGVVKDFHFRSLHFAVRPLAFTILPRFRTFILIRLRAGDIPGALASLERIWKDLNPNMPFSITFMDEAVDRLYRAEQQLGTMFRYFTLLGIVIACLGLFGLASFTAEQRTKEIGIRKVLGATASQVMALLSTEFMRWIVVANVVAWPVAYFVMREWLSHFAYRTNITLAVFILSGGLSAVIALITVSFQAVKAAVANPVESLKYE